MGNRANLLLLLWVVIAICSTVLGFRWWVVANRVPLGAAYLESAASSPEPAAEASPSQARSVDERQATAGRSETAQLLNLNSATLEELEMLPGIGPVLGQRILDYRARHGPFSSVAGLLQVSGIGEKKLEQLRPLVYVSGSAGHR